MLKKIFIAVFIAVLSVSGISFSGSKIKNKKLSNSDSTAESEKFYHLISEHVIGWNDVYQTPYFVLKGKTESPKMLIQGGMHGDEIASYMACDSIIRNINLLEGTLIIIPRLNILADQKNTRFINIDLNHAFPGDQGSDVYEFRLAYELMWLVDSIKPDIIINLHEALTKYDSEFQNDSEKAFGQIVITCIKPFEEILITAVDNMNEKIPFSDFKFHAHYYTFRQYSSLDNFVSKFNIKSYTIETYRGFKIDDRVKLQQVAVLQFMDEAGLKYEYPEIKF